MINVEHIFKSVKDLASKDKAGYFSSDEFNRASRLAEDELYGELLQGYEGTKQVSDFLRPFVAETTIPCPNGVSATPANFGRAIEVQALVVQNTDSEPALTLKPARYIHPQEVAASYENTIRAPKEGVMYRYTNDAGGLRIFPGAHAIKLRYLMIPTYAVRGYTVDTVNLEEDFNQGASTDYQWPAEASPLVVNKILRLLGFAARSPEIVSFTNTQQ